MNKRDYSFNGSSTMPDKEPTRNDIFNIISLIVSCLYYTILIYLGKIKPKHQAKRVFLLLKFQLGCECFPFLLVLEDNKQISEDIQIMQTIKADTPDAPFSLEITSAADSEGNPIPVSEFSISTPQSDNVGAFEILDYDASTRRGTGHFGASNPDGTPNIANVSANVTDSQGKVVGVIGDQIAIVHGDVVALEGGLAFEFQPTSGGGEETTPVPPSEGSDVATDESNG